MYQVFESIKVVDHQYYNLTYHLERMQRTCMALWGRHKSMDTLTRQLNEQSTKALCKCKVMYDADGHVLEFFPYTKKELHQLLIVNDNNISYEHKYSNRNVFNAAAEFRDQHQDVIYAKNGLLTDATYSNIALWNGTEWHTPALPLLKGTKRQSLLDKGQVIEKNISIIGLQAYEKISLINAMLDLEETEVPITEIKIL